MGGVVGDVGVHEADFPQRDASLYHKYGFGAHLTLFTSSGSQLHSAFMKQGLEKELKHLNTSVWQKLWRL